MKTLKLTQVNHQCKINEQPLNIKANVNESCLFEVDGEVIGFYLEELPEKIGKLLDLANYEFLSDRVPKMKNWRVDKGGERYFQYSTILGTIPPKPIFKRNYNSTSSVQGKDTAKTFIKAMKILAKESEALIKEHMPDQYKAQLEAMEAVPKKWRFSDMFTSSISNFNISAKYHRDNANIKNTINLIYTKRSNSKGGSLHVPDFDICIDQKDRSLLVYPAWKSMHGVTDIIQTSPGGYRNSLVFYPLRIK